MRRVQKESWGEGWGEMFSRPTLRGCLRFFTLPHVVSVEPCLLSRQGDFVWDCGGHRGLLGKEEGKGDWEILEHAREGMCSGHRDATLEGKNQLSLLLGKAWKFSLAYFSEASLGR